MICRPSDHTVGRPPGPEYNPGKGGDTNHYCRPPHLLLYLIIHHVQLYNVHCTYKHSLGSNPQYLVGLGNCSLVFWANRSFKSYSFLKKEQIPGGCSFVKSGESDSLTVALFKEEQELFMHERSFLKSDESESLTVALYNERFWAKEQRANERKSEFPTLVFSRVGHSVLFH